MQPSTDSTARVRRALHRGDPSEADLRAARAEVVAIRGELSDLRHRLWRVGRVETSIPHDSLANDVSCALTLAVRTLHDLVDGDHDLDRKADRVAELWADADANPDAYVIREGKSS